MNLGKFVTRDGVMLWFLVIGALAGYLLSVGVPPTQWTYSQWLQFAAALAAWGLGKLQTSPAPSKADVAASTPGGSVDPKKFIPMLLLAAALAVGSLGVSGCAKKSPTLSPAGQVAVIDLQVVKALDVVRDTAIALNAQNPPLLSTATTRKIVDFHESAIKTITASPGGWKPTVLAALDQLKADLPSAEWQRLVPYETLVRTLIAEVL